MKSVKIFECSCVDGFTGDFCEFKTEQNQLLYLRDSNGLLLNDEGHLYESLYFDHEVDADSCFTMLNGEGIIFGGWNPHWENNIMRQVTNSYYFHSAFVYFQDFGCFRMHIKTTW